MTEYLGKVAGASLAALKVISMAGPVAVAMAGGGGLLFGMVLSTPSEHNDALLAVAGMMCALGFIEWGLARRFQKHEVVERQDREELVEKMLKANRANLDTVLLQVTGIGAEHDSILRKLKDIQATMAEHTPRLAGMENALHRLEEAVTELERWRARIGDRLGTLR